MQSVYRSLIIFRFVEIALILISLILFFVFKKRKYWRGVCIGLLFQSTVMLIFDFFAIKRGAEYLKYLYYLAELFSRI